METLVTLTKARNMRRFKERGVDGLIFGGLFSLRFKYSLNEITRINDFCKNNGLKRYLAIDAFIEENKKSLLYSYFDFVKTLDLDGIYFSDLGVITCAKSYGMDHLLIYDPDTLMTNSVDISLFLNQGFGVALARELTLKEIVDILKKYPKKIDMQIFGHLKMSYSKRNFLSNYFEHIGRYIDVKDNEQFRIIEDSRNYELPIIEDEFGTRIYTDYIFSIPEELAYLKPYLKRGIIDDSFIGNDELIFDVIRDAKRITRENAAFLRDAFLEKYSGCNLSDAYLYQKTTKTKEENE